jgi:CheY-like chemotaxis protein
MAKILFVEDEADIRDLVTLALEDEHRTKPIIDLVAFEQMVTRAADEGRRK